MMKIPNWVKLFFAGVVTALGAVFLIIFKGQKPEEVLRQIEKQKKENDDAIKKTDDYLRTHHKRNEL